MGDVKTKIKVHKRNRNIAILIVTKHKEAKEGEINGQEQYRQKLATDNKQPLAQRVKKEVQRSWPMYVMLLPAIILAINLLLCTDGRLGYGIPKLQAVAWYHRFRVRRTWIILSRSLNLRNLIRRSLNTFIIAVSKMVLGLIFPIIVALLIK